VLTGIIWLTCVLFWLMIFNLLNNCKSQLLKGNARCYTRGELISLYLYIESNKLRDCKKKLFTLHIPPWAAHTCDFAVLTSLTHPIRILLVVLQIRKIGKAKDLTQIGQVRKYAIEYARIALWIAYIRGRYCAFGVQMLWYWKAYLWRLLLNYIMTCQLLPKLI
jgi:hypothetical protein